MKYVVNVNSISNLLGSPDFFMGTGFFGEEFETYEELKNIILAKARHEVKGKKVFYEHFKLSFAHASTVAAMKADGNDQAKHGMVDMLRVCSIGKSDPLVGIVVYFCRSGWYESDPEKVFHFVIDNNGNQTPVYGKFQDVITKLNITF